VGDDVTFAATLWDKDKDDSVQWTVRRGTCAAGTNTVWGELVDEVRTYYSQDSRSKEILKHLPLLKTPSTNVTQFK
jgi:hypothetical protein